MAAMSELPISTRSRKERTVAAGFMRDVFRVRGSVVLSARASEPGGTTTISDTGTACAGSTRSIHRPAPEENQKTIKWHDHIVCNQEKYNLADLNWKYRSSYDSSQCYELATLKLIDTGGYYSSYTSGPSSAKSVQLASKQGCWRAEIFALKTLSLVLTPARKDTYTQPLIQIAKATWVIFNFS